MSVFIQLLHGRNAPDENLSDWGFSGPKLGPFVAVHFTYMATITAHSLCGDETDLKISGDLIEHEGKFYGDFEIVAEADEQPGNGPTEDELQRMAWAAEMLPPGTSSRGWRAYVLRFAAWLTRTTD